MLRSHARLCPAPIVVSLCLPHVAASAPWWDDYPTTIQSGDPDIIAASGADSALCGVADDPGWGLHGGRIRYVPGGPRIELLADQGVKLLTWVETFGTCEQYIAEFERLPEGRFRGFETEPETPRPLLNHWGWHTWQPERNREMHWVGLPAYYECEPHAGPWNRKHPRYGAPPFRYPDGREAVGYTEGPYPFRLHRLYDAGCSKSILGQVDLTFGYNNALNEVDATTGHVRGPVDGLVRVETPDGPRYSGLISAGKDFACPHWIEYARASARHIADCGIDGVWSDNFGVWDGFGSRPLDDAFGEWSVHRFRKHLQSRYRADELEALGIAEIESFDVRGHLRRFMRDELGGDDVDLRAPQWGDARWLDEPIWREYRVFKMECGREALQQYHDALQDTAREAGRDLVIQGNDIPMWCFDLPRPGSLHMVSTEFAPGWNLLGGPRGVGLPPQGRTGPIIKMALCHQRGRFVHLWYYLNEPYERYRGNAALGRVLSYELLAHHAMIQAYPHAKQVAGTPESHREVYEFIHACKGMWGDRVPVANVGLLYSPDSRLVTLTPGGMIGFDAQRHAFDLMGWGTALSELHVQYAVVPEWDLTRETLAGLAVLVLPSVEALSARAVDQVLRPWVMSGGHLILSGSLGSRYGRERSHQRVQNAAAMLPELCRLADIDSQSPLPSEDHSHVGAGVVTLLPAVGFEYYQTDPASRSLEAWQDIAADRLWQANLFVGEAPPECEVSIFASPSRPTLFVDIANLDLDPDVDERPTPHGVSVRLRLPRAADGPLSVTLLRPGRDAEPIDVRIIDGVILLEDLRVDDYASVVVEGISAIH